MTRLRALTLLALLGLVASGCSPRTIAAPRDGLELTARFASVDNLVVGHEVQLADVQVGAITDIRLDGFEAVVTFRTRTLELPVGTQAVLGRTSLLGEDVLALRPPATAPPGTPLVRDGDELPAGPRLAGLEELTQRSVELLAALSGDDLPRLLDASSEILVGQEDAIAALLDDLAVVTGHYADQRGAIEEVIDRTATFGAELVDNEAALVRLLDDVHAATGTLAEQRTDAAALLRAFGRLTEASEGSILGDTRGEFEAVLAELGPVLTTFSTEDERLHAMLDELATFVERLPEAVRDDELELYGYTTYGPPRGSDAEAVRSLLEPGR